MRIRAAWMLASLALVLLPEKNIFASGTNAPPHVDTSGVNLQPAYPQTAIQNMERGAIVLGVAVTAEGRVTRIALIGTSGFNDLDASAIATVFGWKFLPATEDGSPVEGTTMVKLVFEPPTAHPDAAGSQRPASDAADPQQPPPASHVLFPAQMTMSADDGKQDMRSFAIPCRRGAFEGNVTIGHDAKQGGELAEFIVFLSAGSDIARFTISHSGSRLVNAILDHVVNGESHNGASYWGSGETGVQIPVSVGWGPGHVIGNGGVVFGQHQIDFGKDPEKLDIAAYSGDVTISNARLLCLPNSP